ncbi:MAG: hypothetical protein RLZ98_3766 [Pseudomonadota bacterium]
MSALAIEYDAIIIGAGAAGMMCAAVAGSRGRRILLLDHADRPGKKILISGGGRCNFTNLETSADRFISDNPHFAKSALGRYRPDDFIALVDSYGIAWHEKTLGQLFCDGSARQIVAMLESECAKSGVTLMLAQTVQGIDHRDRLFRLTLQAGEVAAPALVLSTGGPSIPKMGATGFAYDVARRFGLDVVTPRPALVPFTLGRDDADFTALAGVSAPVRAATTGIAFDEAFLCTHRGLSGPAILQISSYWCPGQPIHLDFLPGLSPGWLKASRQARPRASLQALLAEVLPLRLARAIAARLVAAQSLPATLANVPDRTLDAIETALAHWQFMPTGTEGFAKAEVTAGGVATAGLSSRTMEARSVPGLYVIGEAVDVTGWLGGYNFQWAWSSGWAAGQAL